MSQSLSFSDLVSASSGPRKTNISIVGLGLVTVTELTAVEAAELREDFAACSKGDGGSADESESNLVVTRWAVRLMTGRKAADGEVDKLMASQSADVISSIYLQGLAFNLLADDSREAVEKN